MDFHFLIRNGLSGGVFLAFVVSGIWVGAGADEAQGALKWMSDHDALVIAVSPLLGVMLQGLYLTHAYRSGSVFEDAAREIVAGRIRGNWLKDYGCPLDDHSSDNLFVPVYHSQAQNHFIEWARRRRSYYYLGKNCIYGAALGSATGLIAVAFSASAIQMPLWGRAVLGASSVLAVALVTLPLARRMKQDADRAEAIWAVSYLRPDFHANLPFRSSPPG